MYNNIFWKYPYITPTTHTLHLQVYQERAQEDKERFIQEYVAYQETDSYKEFIRKKFPTLSKKIKTDDEKSGASQTPTGKASAPPPKVRGQGGTVVIQVHVCGMYCTKLGMFNRAG